MLVNREKIRILKNNSLFKGLPEEYFNSSLKMKNFINVKDGVVLYGFDQESSEIYLVIDGEVKIKFNKEKIIEFKILFDFFGEAEILAGCNRFSSAVANKDCILYKMSADELKQLSKTSNALIANLNKNEEEEEVNENILSETIADYDSILDTDNPSLENEVIDFDQEKKEEVFDDLSEEDLDNILEKQRSKHKRDSELNEKQIFKDEDLEDLSSDEI